MFRTATTWAFGAALCTLPRAASAADDYQLAFEAPVWTGSEFAREMKPRPLVDGKPINRSAKEAPAWTQLIATLNGWYDGPKGGRSTVADVATYCAAGTAHVDHERYCNAALNPKAPNAVRQCDGMSTGNAVWETPCRAAVAALGRMVDKLHVDATITLRREREVPANCADWGDNRALYAYCTGAHGMADACDWLGVRHGPACRALSTADADACRDAKIPTKFGLPPELADEFCEDWAENKPTGLPKLSELRDADDGSETTSLDDVWSDISWDADSLDPSQGLLGSVELPVSLQAEDADPKLEAVLDGVASEIVPMYVEGPVFTAGAWSAAKVLDDDANPEEVEREQVEIAAMIGIITGYYNGYKNQPDCKSLKSLDYVVFCRAMVEPFRYGCDLMADDSPMFDACETSRKNVMAYEADRFEKQIKRQVYPDDDCRSMTRRSKWAEHLCLARSKPQSCGDWFDGAAEAACKVLSKADEQMCGQKQAAWLELGVPTGRMNAYCYAWSKTDKLTRMQKAKATMRAKM